QSRRLGQHEQDVVLEDHPQSHGLGCQQGRLARWELPGERIPRVQASPGLAGRTVHQDESLPDQPLHLAPARVRKQVHQVLVETRHWSGDRVRPRGHAGRGRRLRRKVLRTRSTTPMLIAESARLKIGQYGTWMKSMTDPRMPRSYAVEIAPTKIRANPEPILDVSLGEAVGGHHRGSHHQQESVAAQVFQVFATLTRQTLSPCPSIFRSLHEAPFGGVPGATASAKVSAAM